MTREFSVTFDYLCPFARNAHEHVLAGLAAGADWRVSWLPYSLSQGHVGEGEEPVWDRQDPWSVSGVLALAVGMRVRDSQPERFPAAHRELFAVRHDHAEDLRDPDALARALERAGVPAAAVLDPLPDDEALDRLRREHEHGVQDHGVWGVPTFVTDERAVFVRLMDRPGNDGALARRRIEQVLDLVDGAVELNEFKQVDLPR